MCANIAHDFQIGVHARLDFVVNELVIALRPFGYDQRFPIVRDVTPGFFGHEGHERVQHAQTSVLDCNQDTAGRLLVGFRSFIDGVFADFQVDRREFLPQEGEDLPPRFTILIDIEKILHICDQAMQSAQDPARRQIQLLKRGNPDSNSPSRLMLMKLVICHTLLTNR